MLYGMVVVRDGLALAFDSFIKETAHLLSAALDQLTPALCLTAKGHRLTERTQIL